MMMLNSDFDGGFYGSGGSGTCSIANAEGDALDRKQHAVYGTGGACAVADSSEWNFKELSRLWKRETKLFSNVTKKCTHPYYQKIIGMGKAVVPLILGDLRENGPNDWFWALTAITGENPITQAISGNMKAMTEAWLLWGMQAGYRIDCH
jgi:hypothetical protein